MAGKTKKQTGRVETEKPPDKHAEQCAVCKHLQRVEIEARYFNFEPTAEVASDYALSHDSIDRHARYYQLGVKRTKNTEKVLESLVEHGMRQLAKVPLETVLDSIKELHKIRGKHKEPAKNPEDAARSAMADFLSKNPHAKREDIAPIYAEQYGVSVEQISEAIH